MSEFREICRIVSDLIETLQLQAAELERIVVHLEQQTVRLDPSTQFPLVISNFSALHRRIKQLADHAPAAG
jgi:acyl carrier protein phosphodiesterase